MHINLKARYLLLHFGIVKSMKDEESVTNMSCGILYFVEVKTSDN